MAPHVWTPDCHNQLLQQLRALSVSGKANSSNDPPCAYQPALAVVRDGQQRRDWLYVTDHCTAIRAVLDRGRIGETYNIGGRTEKANVDVVHALCDILDVEKPRADGRSYRQQIEFVGDRPGHGRRYAMDAGKIERDLGWKPAETFETGLRKTVRWYLDNTEWVERVVTGTWRSRAIGGVRHCQKVHRDVSMIHLSFGPLGDRFQ